MIHHVTTMDSPLWSMRLGIDPSNYARHTAMGDVEWVVAQWDAWLSFVAVRDIQGLSSQ